MAGNGIKPEQESHVLPSAGSPNPDAANAGPNPPSTPLSTIPALALDKTPPATSCNLLSWFRHPLAMFKASLKRRRCASSGDNSTAGRKKKAQILGDACADDDEAAEAKSRLEKKQAPGSDPEVLAEPIPKAICATTTAHINDDGIYVKKEDMAIAGKEEKAKGREQQGSPENVVEKKWDGEPIDAGDNNDKVIITSPNNKMPESAPITNEEAAAGIHDYADENAEAAAPATEHTDVTAVSGIREIK